MKSNIRFPVISLVAFLLLGCLFSCGKKQEPSDGIDTTVPDVTVEESGEPDFEYPYPDLDCNNETITIRGLSWLWDMYIFLDASNTGDKLDREIYERNIGIEKRFNCDIVVSEFLWNWDMDEYINNISNSLQANLDAWDVVYIPLNQRPDLITMGYFQDLKTLNALQLDQPWWDTELNNTFEPQDSLYFASSPLQLQAFDSAWAMFFNETLLKDRGMQSPRELVASNEWTIEKLDELCAEGANINSAPSFYYGDGKGDQIYGLSAHPLLPDKLLYAAGEQYVLKNSDGIPTFRADSETFSNMADQLAALLGQERNIRASYTDMVPYENGEFGETGGYVYIFVQDRAFFMGAEIKTSRVIKNYDADTVSYGIVPLPKQDSSQASYYTPVVETLLTMTIPVTCRKTEMVTQVIDAMAYESYANVLPVYYDQLLYRGYTAEDEPIMEILRSSRGVDIAYYYGWVDTLAEKVRDSIFEGNGSISSVVDGEKTGINTMIDSWVKKLQEMKATAKD